MNIITHEHSVCYATAHRAASDALANVRNMTLVEYGFAAARAVASRWANRFELSDEQDLYREAFNAARRAAS